jgi:hypothetical protein
MNYAKQTSCFFYFKSHHFRSSLCGKGPEKHAIAFKLVIAIKVCLNILTTVMVSSTASNVDKEFI